MHCTGFGFQLLLRAPSYNSVQSQIIKMPRAISGIARADEMILVWWLMARNVCAWPMDTSTTPTPKATSLNTGMFATT